ncbi:hypothetical protein FOZG_02542 [Fusarium oxysporum Fo47]|uniref:Uncharacterized protein n=1 Tax=Fusarium oxysporum Fo47 TaxID=660027 RepID=W9KZ94_FUSOX|nr:hypothetical protein FOZG_02542 [Fusarium oxysporum Fo47]
MFKRLTIASAVCPEAWERQLVLDIKSLTACRYLIKVPR